MPLEQIARQAKPEQVLEALASYLADPKNVPRLIVLFGQLRELLIAEYLQKLGRAYRRVYRRPSPKNCNALMKIEADRPTSYDPHSYYDRMKEHLEESFAQLGDHPVFSNLRLRRDLLTLRARTLTLFYTPQLVRDRGRASNTESLEDAVQRLRDLPELEFESALCFLKLSLSPDGQGYNSALMSNLSFVAYSQYEVARTRGSNTRRARECLHLTIRRVRRHSKPSRAAIRKGVITHWRFMAEVPSALELWADMLAGDVRFDLARLSRQFHWPRRSPSALRVNASNTVMPTNLPLR